MKKVISALLVALMIVTLFSCSGKTTASSPSPSPTPSASPSAAAPSVAPSEAAPSEAAPSSAAPSLPADITKNSDKVGFFADGVDPQSRKTYNIVHMYPFSLSLYTNVTKCLETYAERLNYTVTASTSEGDYDKFCQNIQMYADQGETDGFIVVIDADSSARIKEVLDETQIPYTTWCNSVRDKTTNAVICPGVGMDQKVASETTLQWLYDNYKTYWGDIDPTQIALLNTNASSNTDLRTRAESAEALFMKLLPQNAGVFNVDMVSDFSTDTAYNQAAATFSAHPDVKYWFSTNTVEMYAQGVTRAAENLGIDNKVLVTSVGMNILVAEWDANYDGCWVSCLYIDDYTQAVPAVCGVIALIEGKATPESLWADQRGPGDVCTFLAAPAEMITIDTYKAAYNAYAEVIGIPLPYAN